MSEIVQGEWHYVGSGDPARSEYLQGFTRGDVEEALYKVFGGGK